MSQSAAQASAFYKEVAASGKLWTIRDAGGFPAPKNHDGQRAQPFWSSLARVRKIIATVPAYAGFEPVEVGWHEFASRWVPGLERDGVRVGVNWSGERASGFDVEPAKVKENVEAQLGA
jgi:hypothetical protein